jgi:hypothetical protein
MGKVEFKTLKRGQEFEWRNNYYIVDDCTVPCAIQLTGYGAGRVIDFPYERKVRPVILLVEEE